MQLSKNFSLAEMLHSDTANKEGFTEQYNPPQQVLDNLKILCEKTLQPLRDVVGVPFQVTSGYRCERLNEYISGARGSSHLTGEAADIKLIGAPLLSIPVLANVLEVPYHKIILEYGTVTQPLWIHISHKTDGNNARQILVKQQRQPYRLITTDEMIMLTNNFESFKKGINK